MQCNRRREIGGNENRIPADWYHFHPLHCCTPLHTPHYLPLHEKRGREEEDHTAHCTSLIICNTHLFHTTLSISFLIYDREVRYVTTENLWEAAEMWESRESLWSKYRLSVSEKMQYWREWLNEAREIFSQYESHQLAEESYCEIEKAFSGEERNESLKVWKQYLCNQ